MIVVVDENYSVYIPGELLIIFENPRPYTYRVCAQWNTHTHF